ELGRPDHQSLLILLVTIAICADWSSQTLQPTNVASAGWLTSVIAWAVAIWVSAYEPLVLFVLLVVVLLVLGRKAAPLSRPVSAKSRRGGGVLFLVIIAAAGVIEWRIPP